MTSHASFGGAHHAHFLGGDSEVFAAQSSSDSGWWYDDWSGPSFHSEPSSTPADDPDVGELQPAELEDEQIREAVQSEGRQRLHAVIVVSAMCWERVPLQPVLRAKLVVASFVAVPNISLVIVLINITHQEVLVSPLVSLAW